MKTFLIVVLFFFLLQGIGLAQNHCKDAYKVSLDCYGGSMSTSDVWSYYKNREYVRELAQLCQSGASIRRYMPVDDYVKQTQEWFDNCIAEATLKKQKAHAGGR